MTVFHLHNAQSPLVTAMVCIGDIYHLMNFFSFSRWLFIGLATLGLIVHRHRHPELHSPFKVTHGIYLTARNVQACHFFLLFAKNFCITWPWLPLGSKGVSIPIAQLGMWGAPEIG